jgi:hypothetical protein
VDSDEGKEEQQMKHQRPDYMRIQEPTKLLAALTLLVNRADVMETPTEAEVKEAKDLLKWYGDLPPVEHPIGENEPVFLLRAKDRFAPEVVDEYARRCSDAGLPIAQVVFETADSICAWQREHGSKTPDQPALFDSE